MSEDMLDASPVNKSPSVIKEADNKESGREKPGREKQIYVTFIISNESTDIIKTIKEEIKEEVKSVVKENNLVKNEETPENITAQGNNIVNDEEEQEKKIDAEVNNIFFSNQNSNDSTNIGFILNITYLKKKLKLFNLNNPNDNPNDNSEIIKTLLNKIYDILDEPEN